MNDTAGREQPNNPIQFWENTAEGQHNNLWNPVIVGTVKDGEGDEFWPFDDGSQLNKRYNGLPVYQFQLSANVNYCISQVDFSAAATSGILTLQNCASSTNEEFVYSSDKFLICAGASNTLYSATGAINSPVWIDEETGTGDGKGVYMEPEAVLTWSINALL